MTSDSARAGIEQSLTQLVADLRTAAGTNLVGVALYGGLAKGRFTPGISDVNVLVLLRAAGFRDLERVAPVLTGARRSSRVTTFVATQADLREAARLFPVKLRDIQLAHRVLYGEVPLAALQIDSAALRLRALQELSNIRFRLRQRAVERGAEPRVLWGGLVQSLPKLAVTLETILASSSTGATTSRDRAAVLRQAGQVLGISAQALEPFLNIHREDAAPADPTIRDLFGQYLDLLATLAERVADSAARL